MAYDVIPALPSKRGSTFQTRTPRNQLWVVHMSFPGLVHVRTDGLRHTEWVAETWG